MSPTGFEPAIPESQRQQTHALDRAANKISHINVYTWLIYIYIYTIYIFVSVYILTHMFFNPSLGSSVVKSCTHRPITFARLPLILLTTRVWYLSKSGIKHWEIRCWGHVCRYAVLLKTDINSDYCTSTQTCVSARILSTNGATYRSKMFSNRRCTEQYNTHLSCFT